MNPLHRWLKFNLVGLLGMAVQLATLAVLNHLAPHFYLLTTTAALEVTLLHNFLWHRHYTWRDRRTPSLVHQLLRFHLMNGSLSLLGNLTLMPLLLHNTRLHLLPANLLTIFTCSIANFFLSHYWAFREHTQTRPATKLHVTLACSLLLLLIEPRCMQAQTTNSELPAEPAPEKQMSHYLIAGNDFSQYMGVFCGVGASSSPVSNRPTIGCGAGGTLIPYIFTEFGVMGPQANRSYVSAYLSVDANIPLASQKSFYSPAVLFGYSRLFETGHALDYGLSIALPQSNLQRPLDRLTNIRIEIRDYYTFANPSQHNIMLRIGWVGPATD